MRLRAVGWRLASLVSLAFALVGGAGCFTIATLSEPGNTTTQKQGPVVLRDSIVALGRPSAELRQSMHNEHVIAFLGRQHTYLLVEGGEHIYELARQLDAERLTLVEDNFSLYIEADKVWGDVSFGYALDPNGGEEESRKLEALGFHCHKLQCRRSVNVVGAVYPPLAVDPALLERLKQPRDVALRQPPAKLTRPNTSKFLYLPVAIAVDVVTAPIQIVVGLSALALVAAASAN